MDLKKKTVSAAKDKMVTPVTTTTVSKKALGRKIKGFTGDITAMNSSMNATIGKPFFTPSHMISFR
jgi:hypothetical protein